MARKNARPFGPNESLNGDAGSATEVYVASTRALAAILSPLVAHWMGGGQPKGSPSAEPARESGRNQRIASGTLVPRSCCRCFRARRGVYEAGAVKSASYTSSYKKKKKSMQTVSLRLYVTRVFFHDGEEESVVGAVTSMDGGASVSDAGGPVCLAVCRERGASVPVEWLGPRPSEERREASHTEEPRGEAWLQGSVFGS